MAGLATEIGTLGEASLLRDKMELGGPDLGTSSNPTGPASGQNAG